MKLKGRVDNAHSKMMRLMIPYCVVCGKTEPQIVLNCGHLFSRAAMSTRWDFHDGGNCYVQCAGCNLKHEFDFYPFSNWYTKKFGQKMYDELHARHWTTKKYSISELEELLETFNDIVKEMQCK